MNLNNINPFARFVEKRRSVFPYINYVMAYDHRIFYVYSGSISADVSGECYEVNSNEMLIIPPAVKYKLNFSENILFTVINFDVMTTNKDFCAIEPQTEKCFDYSRIFSSETCSEFPCLLSCGKKAFSIVSELERVFISKSIFRDGIVSSLLKLLITSCVSYTSFEEYPQLITKITQFVDENYSLPISNKMIGDIFSYHPNYINRVFKKCIGQSLHNYILNVRLEKAVALIRETTLPLSDISQQCGFCTQAYFTKKFKEKFNTTPNKLKNKIYF